MCSTHDWLHVRLLLAAISQFLSISGEMVWIKIDGVGRIWTCWKHRSLCLAQAAITRTFAEAAPMSFAVADLYSVAAFSSWNLAGPAAAIVASWDNAWPWHRNLRRAVGMPKGCLYYFSDVLKLGMGGFCQHRYIVSHDNYVENLASPSMARSADSIVHRLQHCEQPRQWV